MILDEFDDKSLASF